jgi:hypothetical protein
MAGSQWATFVATVIVSGFFGTIIAQLIKRTHWSRGVNVIVSLAVAAIVGLASSWLDGSLLNVVAGWGHGLTAEQVIAYMSGVFVTMTAFYESRFGGLPWFLKLGRWPDSTAPRVGSDTASAHSGGGG